MLGTNLDKCEVCKEKVEIKPGNLIVGLGEKIPSKYYICEKCNKRYFYDPCEGKFIPA